MIAAGAAALVVDPVPGAAAAEQRERTWFATLYAGKYARSRFGEIPTNVATGRLRFHDAYLVSGSLSYVLVPSIGVDAPLLGPFLDGSSIEIEGLAGMHFGDQDHGEVVIGALWRSPEYRLLGDLQFNYAVGEGFSYALSRPKLEAVVRRREPHRLLNYLAVETEFSHPSLPGVSVLTRVHHRSGIFGVIAPRSFGSNFVGTGLRVTLQ